jgi:uncharacterized protein YhbP (UPF0306 family)
LETSVVSKVQGIQFRGRMRRPTEGRRGSVTRAYLARFPFAVLMNASLWIVEIHSVKMTDNRLGFGKRSFTGKDKAGERYARSRELFLARIQTGIQWEPLRFFRA